MQARTLIFSCALGSVLCSGCATSGYLADRTRDAADVFTATLIDATGLKVRAGPLNVGVFSAGNEECGLRGGECSKFVGEGMAMVDLVLLVFSLESFDPNPGTSEEGRRPSLRGKTYASEGILGLPFTSASPSYYTDFEVAAGVGKGFRLGFNPGELVDFILGWSTIDIYRDDLARLKAELRTARGIEAFRLDLKNMDAGAGRRAVPQLISASQSRDPLVRVQVALTLGEVKEQAAVEHLITMLQDRDAAVRRYAVYALGQTGNGRVIGPLFGALEDASSDVRAEAVERLGRMGDEKAVEPLIGKLHDSSEKVRLRAIYQLGEIGDKRAVGPLVELLKTGKHNWEAERALRKITGVVGTDSGNGVEHWQQWSEQRQGAPQAP